MQYLYHTEAKAPTLRLRGDEHRYIFKVRRHRKGEIIALRNLKDDNIYYYRIISLDKKEAYLVLENSEKLIIKAKKKLHIGWCIIEPKNIEKVLPTLNEIGVTSISFIYCTRSQKSFKLDFKRLEKILLNSSQQCGRSDIMKLEIVDSLENFLDTYPNAKALNFSENRLSNIENIDSIVIGCEGGFSKDERELLKKQESFRLNSPMVLRSESAVLAVGSKILV